MALDHPAAIEIVTNEKFKSPPFPEFRLFGVRAARLSRSRARRSAGATCCRALLQRDRVYPDAFRRDHAGVAEMHHLDLDFGAAARSQPRRADPATAGWIGPTAAPSSAPRRSTRT